MKISPRASGAGPRDPRRLWSKAMGVMVWPPLISWLAGPSRKPPGKRYAAAVVKLDRLGDFVLALGAIRVVLDRFGPENCVLVVSVFADELARREFPGTDVLIVPAMLTHRDLWRKARGVREIISRLGVDTVVCLRHQRWDYDELLLSWFGGARVWRIEDGFARSTAPWDRLYDAPQEGELSPPAEPAAGETSEMCRELIYHRAVVEAALGRAVGRREVEPRLAGAGAGAGIVVSPFGSEAIKDFPHALLSEALASAREIVRGPITFVGTPAQRERLHELASRTAGDAPFAVRCDLDLPAYLNLVAGAGVVISTDTATAHIATAMDKPTLVALGGGHWGQFGPWRRSARQQWISTEIACRGCNWRCLYPEPRCLTEIPASMARDAVRAVLSDKAADGACPLLSGE